MTAHAVLHAIPDDALVAELRRRGYTVTPPEPPPATLEAFRRSLFAIIDELDRGNRRLGLVPIPAVRRALGAEHFDRLVLKLAERGEVSLVPHDHPARLPADELAGCIRDPALGQVYYWFRWGM